MGATNEVIIHIVYSAETFWPTGKSIVIVTGAGGAGINFMGGGGGWHNFAALKGGSHFSPSFYTKKYTIIQICLVQFLE